MFYDGCDVLLSAYYTFNPAIVAARTIKVCYAMLCYIRTSPPRIRWNRSCLKSTQPSIPPW